jgi:hypothetical protein
MVGPTKNIFGDNTLAYSAAASVTTKEKHFVTLKQGGAAGQLHRKSERTQTSGDGDEELDQLANHFYQKTSGQDPKS